MKSNIFVFWNEQTNIEAAGHFDILNQDALLPKFVAIPNARRDHKGTPWSPTEANFRDLADRGSLFI